MSEFIPSQHEPDCKRCKLCQTRKHIVPSILPSHAKILFLAEGPGANEDASGTQPLIGQAGHMFDDCLLAAGIERSEVAIANVVRCRPPNTDPKKPGGNRTPKTPEVRACAEFLEKEIELLKPSLIVCLGNTAYKRITGEDKPGPLRGKVLFHTKYQNILPTFHPAAILYNPRERSSLIGDMITAKEFVDSGGKTQIPYSHQIIRNIEQARWLFDKLMKAEMFSFDIETSAFDYLESKILSIAFSWKKYTAVCLPLLKEHLEEIWTPEEYEEIRAGLKKALMNPTSKKIAHNGKYDTQHLFASGFPVQNFYADTMLMHYLLDENSLHGLKSLAWTYTDLGGYEDELNQVRKKIAKEKGRKVKELSFAEVPGEILWPYNNKDADVTFRIFHSMWPQLERENLTGLLFELFIPMAKLLSKIEYEGVNIDRKYLEEIVEVYKEKIKQKDILLQQDPEVLKYVRLKREEYRRKRKEKWESTSMAQKRYSLTEYQEMKIDEIAFNPNSSKQLIELFIKQLKLSVFKETEKGNPSIDDEALEHYAKKVPIASIMSQRNKLLHLSGTFLVGIGEVVRRDGRVHTSFNLHIAETGRLSSTAPNLQNIPNTRNNPEDSRLIRDIFVASEGCSLLEADYKQAEFRMWGQLSQDEVLHQDLRDLIDIHRRIGSLGFGIPEDQITKEQRGASKEIVFGTMYGRSARSVAEQLGISIRQAEKIQEAIFKRYRKGAQWVKLNLLTARREKVVTGVFGQRRHLLGLIDSSNNEIRAKAERQTTNCVIQGSASQMTCFGGLRVMNLFREHDVRGRIVMLIHDAIVYDIRDEDLERSKVLIKEGMLDPHPKITVPLGIDMKVGKKWGQMKEVEE